MRVVFFGTPAFAVPTLTALAGSSHEVVAVVTQPDRPRGRGQKVSPSAVKADANWLRIPVLQPDTMKDVAFTAALAAYHPDLGVVAAYGKILPTSLINLPARGMINVHASLLPRWRGAAPVHRAILAGDATTGVTIMRVVKALDAGPMLATVETPISPEESSAELEQRLATLGADLLVRTVDRMSAGQVTETPQDETRVTYASRLQRDEGRIDFARPAIDVHNSIRGLQPWPLASASLGGKRVLLLASQALPNESTTSGPGTVVRVEPDALVVATSSGAVRITRLQLEGRPAVATRDFLNGHAVRPGDRLVPAHP